MTIDKDKLRRSALAISEGSGLEGPEAHDAMVEFEGLATPATVLALLGEIDRLESDAASMRGSLKAQGKDLTTAVRACSKAVRERDQLKAEIERLRAAEKTLQNLGYRHDGGELWRPPLGKKPDFNLIDQLKAENEALSYLLKRFVDGEHDDAEDQNERHHYHGEAQALLTRMSGEFQEYSLVPYEALRKHRTELVELRRDAERLDWIDDNYTGHGGGTEFNLRLHLPCDIEDGGLRHAIDAAMAKEKGHD